MTYPSTINRSQRPTSATKLRTIRHAFFISLLCILLAASYVLPSHGKAAPAGPLRSVDIVGSPQIVFDTDIQSCEKTDIPDISARAFKDSTGTVHFFAAGATSRAMTGPSLNHLTHSCDVVYASKKNADPSQFSDSDWLGSFLTNDGRHVMALVHNEYHGWAHDGMCTMPRRSSKIGHCWWDSIGFAMSNDGGYHFEMPAAPRNVVAEESQPYDKDNDYGPVGYTLPTNIVAHDGAYEFMFHTWARGEQRNGECLMRSTNAFDPASWRAWDGEGFNVRFANPYAPGATTQGQIVCKPVYSGLMQGVVYSPTHNIFLGTEIAQDRRYGTPGLYITTSPDMIHWSRPVLVVDIDTLNMSEPGGQWHYDYMSLLDPSSSDRNFSTVSDHCFVYYEREDMSHPPFKRRLYRLDVQLRIT